MRNNINASGLLRVHRCGYVATRELVSPHHTQGTEYIMLANEYDEYNTRVWIKIQLM